MTRHVGAPSSTCIRDCTEAMRIGVVAESFLPHVNGVTNSVLRILEHFRLRGLDAVVLAPGSASHRPPQAYADTPICTMPSLPVPRYPQVRISLARRRTVASVLAEHDVDIVHLASPFITGPPAQRAAAQLDVPVVAVYQTDLAAFVTRYGMRSLSTAVWRHIRMIHAAADLTLAPSRSAIRQLTEQGIPRVSLWSRGVDAELFHPKWRSRVLRRHLAPHGEVLIGYMGRLAPEKCLDDLRVLTDIPRTRLVMIGDGPDRARLQRIMPSAVFLGLLRGQDLARAVATLDVAVHPGPHETFCQSLQEVLASGVPAVAVGAGGPLDLIDASRNGWLYAPGDLEDLRARVVDLVGDPAKSRLMGRRAREGVEGRTWQRVGDELIDHYASVTGQAETRLPTAA